MFHNAARNGKLWVLAFFLSVEAKKYASQGSDALVVRAQGLFLSGGAGRGGGADQDGSDPQVGGDGGAAAISEAKNTNGGKAEGKMVIWDDDGDRVMPRDATVASLLHCTDCDGHTPLDWACYSGHAGVARLLVEHGLNPFSTDAGGKNCLHWAASQVRERIITRNGNARSDADQTVSVMSLFIGWCSNSGAWWL